MASKCYAKCVVKQSDGELQIGEMMCVDRCTGKYLEAQDRVGKALHNFEEQVKAQEAAGLKSYGVLPKPQK